MPRRFAWADATGLVHVTTLTEEGDQAIVIGQLIADGHMPPGATIVQDPVLPASRDRRFAWRIVAGQVIDQVAIPAPPHPRQALLNQVDAIVTLAQAQAVLRQIVDKGL